MYGKLLTAEFDSFKNVGLHVKLTMWRSNLFSLILSNIVGRDRQKYISKSTENGPEQTHLLHSESHIP